MLSPDSVSQWRTQTHLYVFKAESDLTLQVKVYDASQTRILKKALSTEVLGIPNVKQALSDPSALFETIFQKKLLLIDPPSSPSVSILEECLTDIEKIIAQLQPKVLFENKELEEFTCPISLEVFNDPVIDNDGHTFEEKIIEEHRKTNNTCPISRVPITSLTPNRILKDRIEKIKQQNPIPTFALFKNSNTKLANMSLEMAQECIKSGEYEQALNSYSQALQYTKAWQDYEKLPLLFELMKEENKASLAYLYLIQYQLQDKKILDALKTVEEYTKKYPEFVQVYPLLFKLYRCTEQTSKAVTFGLQIGEALGKQHPQEAIQMYRQILTEDPYQLMAYEPLAHLLKDSHEKAHILLQGACCAIQQKKYEMASTFCLHAEQFNEESFVDRLVELNLLSKQGISAKQKIRDMAVFFEKKDKPSLMIKAYRMLAHLNYDPIYYEKIIAGYEKIDYPKKALQWRLAWLSLLIEKKEWEKAEQLAKAVQYETVQKIPIYEQLETIYTHSNPDNLNDLWVDLGMAYFESGRIDEAEKTYRKGCEKFHTYEHVIGLAATLIRQNKIDLGVQAYYEAASIALENDDLDSLCNCIENIKEVDPDMNLLKPSHKRLLLTQTKMLELSKELKETKEDLSKIKVELSKDYPLEFVALVKNFPKEQIPKDVTSVLEGRNTFLKRYAEARNTLIVWEKLAKQLQQPLFFPKTTYESSGSVITEAAKFPIWFSSMKSLPQITKLDLRNKQLTSIPSEINTLFSLTSLDLSINQFTLIPTEVFLGKNRFVFIPSLLKSLNLANNQLKQIPEAIGGLQSLESLDLSQNQISKIPQALGTLPQLKELHLKGNQFILFPRELRKLSKLEVLDLSNNNLISVSLTISDLSGLKKLILKHNNLTTISNEIGNLSKLKKLDVAENRLDGIPPGIFKLPNLKELRLENNKITDIPTQISELTTLSELSLFYNQITIVPREVCKLTQLNVLRLSQNEITDIPEEIGELSELELLTLFHNKISSIPRGIGKLSTLNNLSFSSNEISEIPVEIAQLTQIKELDLSKNPLTSIPKEIGGMKKLKKLCLGGTKITAIPDEVTKLTSLEVVLKEENEESDLI